MTDRDYWYLVRTLAAPTIAPADFAALFTDAGLSGFLGWRRTDQVIGIDAYHKIGEVLLQTETTPIREWEYCLVSELAPATDPARLGVAARVAAELEALARRTIDCLSIELMVRPTGAGTAIPRPSPHWRDLPPHFHAAIEYIQIPDEHWQAYKDFMRISFGPIGRALVDRGSSYTVTITELVQSFHRSPTLPDWNRMHILTGDFTRQSGGFFEHTAELVREIMGAEHTVDSALGLAGYRRKPSMSKNERIYSSHASEPVEAAG